MQSSVPTTAVRTSSRMVLEKMLDEDIDSPRKIEKPEILQQKSLNLDDPYVAARRYCFENNLNPKMIGEVMKQLRSAKKDENSNVNERINRGAMLYERNTRLMEEKKRILRRRAQELKQIKEETLTFQPQINPVSELIVKKKRDEASLLDQTAISFVRSNEKLNTLKKSLEAAEMAECTFHPNISRKSLSKSQCSISRFDELYQDGKKKQSVMLQTAKKSTAGLFHPQINKLSQMIINGVPFEERMKKYAYEKTLKEQKKQQKQEKNITKTPQKRDHGGLSIGQYLYNMRLQKTECHSPSPKSLKIGKQSHKIYESLKTKALLYIFSQLDSDQDGSISATKINISELDRNILRILAPLLAQMQQLNRQLNEHEFLEAGTRMLSTLVPDDRDIILKCCRPQPQERQIVKSASKSRHNIYEQSMFRQKEREKWLKQQRLLKEQRQMEECCFRPVRFSK